MSDKEKPKPVTDGDLVRKYHLGGKSSKWIGMRMGLNEDVVDGILCDIEDEDSQQEENDLQEANFIETPPTTKDRLEYDVVKACSHLAQASSLLLAISEGLGSVLAEEDDLLEFVVATYQESKSENPYEHLVDRLASEYIIIKKSK